MVRICPACGALYVSPFWFCRSHYSAAPICVLGNMDATTSSRAYVARVVHLLTPHNAYMPRCLPAPAFAALGYLQHAATAPLDSARISPRLLYARLALPLRHTDVRTAHTYLYRAACPLPAARVYFALPLPPPTRDAFGSRGCPAFPYVL